MLHPLMTEALARPTHGAQRADAQRSMLVRQANRRTSMRRTPSVLGAALLTPARRAARMHRIAATASSADNDTTIDLHQEVGARVPSAPLGVVVSTRPCDAEAA